MGHTAVRVFNETVDTLETLCGREGLEAMAALASKTPDGCFVEVGVYEGGSASVLYSLAQQQERKIFLYDTFNGIPYKDSIDSHQVGDFTFKDAEGLSAKLPKAMIVQGVFPKSAVEMPPVAFVHLDCDQYRSYKESVEYLESKMVPGGIMWFDDYGCTPGATAYLDEKFGKRMEQQGKYFMRF